VEQTPWSVTSHRAFPVAFQDAAKALLLAIRRFEHGRQGSDSNPYPFPLDCLLEVMRQLATPLWAWALPNQR
jgi:hypothetical protein